MAPRPGAAGGRVIIAPAVVPSANRGLKSSDTSIADAPVEAAIVDFLTFTAPWARMVEGYPHPADPL